jgi:phosphate uptake regulator
MTLEALADLVARMRRQQAAYFRTRDPVVLQASKALERDVDRAVLQILGGQDDLL